MMTTFKNSRFLPRYMENVSDLRILEHIGLTRNEAIVYVELLRTGSVLAKDLTKITNMHRTSVYGCLQRLHKKGLVSISSGNRKTYFEAVDPRKLLSLVQEREERLKSVLPELIKLKNTNFYSKHEVQYFKGRQGLKSIYDEILQAGDNYIGWGPEREIEAVMKYYFIHYVRERQKRKIHAKLVYFEDSRGEEYTKSPLVQIRYLPQSYYEPTAHRVYGDNVAIILLEQEPLCIVIRNKAIAQSYRKHFNIMWERAKK